MECALELFNQNGERNVSTNHIASSLGISPGNLYYHFRNKSDIIFELFKQYREGVVGYLQPPASSEVGLEDLQHYLEAVFRGLWNYRFLHRDLESLLASDSRLREEYRIFTIRCLDVIEVIGQSLMSGRVLAPQKPETLSAMVLNIWLVITNWMAYLKTVQESSDSSIRESDLYRGIGQVLILVHPYTDARYRPAMEEIIQDYQTFSSKLRQRLAG